MLVQENIRQKSRRDTFVGSIPVTVWGLPSTNVVVAVHGLSSSRFDPVIETLSEVTSCQAVSFDLPGHGSRAHDKSTEVWPAEALADLDKILTWADEHWSEVSIFAVSIGAYLSLLACADRPIRRAWLLAPMTDLLTMIQNSMEVAGVSEEQLQMEGTVTTPAGENLSWPYFSFVAANPPSHWPHCTEILHASSDQTVPVEHSIAFAERFDASLKILPDAEHWFHTPDQLRQLGTWLQETQDAY